MRSHELIDDKKFKEAAEKSLAYLMSKEARPMGASFWRWKNPKKDFSNGLMGQAWTLEGLAYAYRAFKDDSIFKLATEVFKIHPYKSTQMAWEVVYVDGSIRRFYPTLNP